MRKTKLRIGVTVISLSIIVFLTLIWNFEKEGFKNKNHTDIDKISETSKTLKDKNTEATTTNEIVSLNIIDTDNWQTCYNNLQGYKISYPEDWFVIIGDGAGPVPLPITAKDCQDGINLNAIEPYPSVGGGPYLFVKKLSLSEKINFATEEYLSEHAFNSFPSTESDIIIFWAEDNNKNYKFLIFGNEDEQAWKITIGRKTRQFAETVVETFRVVE